MKTEFLIPGDLVLKDMDFKLVGRDKELSQLMTVLMRKDAHSVLLVGQGGVGCSALCYGLQEAKGLKGTPFDIVHKRLFWLDIDGLFSNPDESQEAFDSMLKVLTRTNDTDTVLIVEDAKDFLEATNKNGCAHFINQIMRQIKLGTFQVILEVKDTDLSMVRSCHSDMQEMFTLMEVNEPTIEALEDIVNVSSKAIENHHGITVSEEALQQAIHLTTTYPVKDASLSRAQPEATVTLIDRTMATYRKEAHTTPPHLEEAANTYKEDPSEENKENYLTLKKDWEALNGELSSAWELQTKAELRLRSLEEDLDELQQERSNTNSTGIVSSPEEQELAEKIEEVKEVIQTNDEKFKKLSAQVNKGLVLEAKHISEEFSKLSGIPANKFNQDENKKYLNLSDVLKSRVYGQDHVVEQLSNALLTARAPGLKDPKKPDCAFMFCGSSGVGKTELAKALASALKDDEGALLRFDMSEYKTDNTVTNLIGSPAGYAGYERGGILTNAVRKNPHSIILFDEIEKAHDSIFDIFLQVLDDGRLTDTHGRTVSFANTMLIFTTNTGADAFLDLNMPYEDQFEETMKALSERYRGEFLNRFDGRENIVGFKALPPSVIEMITASQLSKINKRMEEQGQELKVVMDKEDIERFCAHNYKPERGARGIDGLFRRHVYPKVARILFQQEETVKICRIGFDNGEFSVAAES